MQRLFQFLYKYRTLILLILLEAICFWIIVKSNSYQGAKYFTSSNNLVASIASVSDQVGDYFELRNQNQLLAKENVYLRQQLLDLTDSVFMAQLLMDSSHRGIKAKVIDNSLFFRNNYLTINKGHDHGIRHGMGVIGPDGIVGQVLHSTSNYATVISLLHSKTMISAYHKPGFTLCSVIWKGADPLYANIEYLPRHISLSPGDSIITSGYNSTYPEGQLIGIVSNVHLDDDDTFYEAEIKLSTNFYTLTHVYIMELKGQEELDSLQINLTQQYE